LPVNVYCWRTASRRKELSESPFSAEGFGVTRSCSASSEMSGVAPTTTG